MIQRGCRARFTPESLDRLRVLRNVFGKKFQRDIPAKARVLGSIDDAHASAAKFFQDGVLGDGATDNGRSVRHGPQVAQPLRTGNRAEILLLVLRL